MQVLSDKIPILSELEEKVKEISPTTGEQKSELLSLFRKALAEIDDAKIRILQLLEMLAEADKEFNMLYQNASEANLSECVNKLNEIGNKRKSNRELKKAFESMGYRLMEQTRAGRRDDVFHSILRLYITCNQVFDKELLIAFKQPNNEMFKVLIFSFLSGVMEPKK
jgi:hypothetical protein